MSSLGRPPAAVRMMTPPVKPCASRNSRTMPRSRDALFARLDLARHADVIDRRHEHQEPPRHRHVRGEPGALGAERLLDDLDDDLLAFLQQVFDLRLRPLAFPFPTRSVAPLAAALVLVVARELVELVERVDDVGDVEEAVALEAEVDEGGLHAGQDFRDPALVDVADDAAVPFAFDEDFGDEIVFEDGHHGLVAVGGDDHLLVSFTELLRQLGLSGFRRRTWSCRSPSPDAWQPDVSS